MIGTAIAAGLGAIGSIWGGMKASKAAQEQQDLIEKQKEENQAWFDKEYNADPTQRTSALRVLQRTEEILKNRNNAAAGTQAVMGGTEESVAAEKEANAKALADATSQVVAQGDARKDAVEAQYLQTKHQLEAQEGKLAEQKGQNIANAVGGVAKAASGIAGAFGSIDQLPKKKEEEQTT